MSSAREVVAVALFGGLGALLRWWLSRVVDGRNGSALPYGTLAVNLSGALVLGFVAGLAPADSLMVALGGGLLGGYTTFSTWMVESVVLAGARRRGLMCLNLVGSTVLGFAAVAAGWALGAPLR